MSNQIDPRDVWQNQTKEQPMPRLEEIIKSVDTFRQKITRRNWLEYSAAFVVVAAFSRIGYNAPNYMIQIGATLTVLATLFIVYFLRKHGAPGELPATASVSEYIAFHRDELVRQRNLLRGVLWWYLAPFLPGMAFFLAGIAEMGTANKGLPVQFRVPVILVVFIGVWLLNRRGAKRLQKQIDALGYDQRQV